MRVFQGVTGQAGQPWTLAEGLRKVGVSADSWKILSHKFGYSTHRDLNFDVKCSLEEAYATLRPLIEQYDVFHFHGRSFLTTWPGLPAPSLQDLMLLRLHGKKVFFHFRGQEIRMASTFKERNPFHYVDDSSGYLFTRIPDTSKVLLRDAVMSLCNGVFVVDEELRTYVPEATVVPRALDGTDWPFVGVGDNAVPVIVHAPSRRGVKGTHALLAALDELRREGVKFELRLVENLSNQEAREIYRSADILVDQLRIGWYGVLAVEALALGKPVVAYIRDDLWEQRFNDLPIWNANPSNIKSRLRQLIEDVPARQRLAHAGRRFFEQEHAAAAVAKKLANIYANAGEPPSLAGYASLLEHQSRRPPPPKVRRRSAGFPGLVEEFLRVRQADGDAAALRAFKNWLVARLRRPVHR